MYCGHGIGIISKAIIGDYVKIKHNVTIGNTNKGRGYSKIVNNVNICSNAVIIGAIKLLVKLKRLLESRVKN